MNEAMILGCLAGVEAAMAVERIPHGRGGIDAAIASLTEDQPAMQEASTLP
jgi:alanine-glyoxylate transaminase/serine-glyoxylate transaminase/serine-pyruvate transaminase